MEGPKLQDLHDTSASVSAARQSRRFPNARALCLLSCASFRRAPRSLFPNTPPPKNRSSSSLREAERPRSLHIPLRADVTQLPACKFEKTLRRSSQRSQSRAPSEPALPCFSLCVFFFCFVFVSTAWHKFVLRVASSWKKTKPKNIHASRFGIINKAFKCCVAVS